MPGCAASFVTTSDVGCPPSVLVEQLLVVIDHPPLLFFNARTLQRKGEIDLKFPSILQRDRHKYGCLPLDPTRSTVELRLQSLLYQAVCHKSLLWFLGTGLWLRRSVTFIDVTLAILFE